MAPSACGGWPARPRVAGQRARRSTPTRRPPRHRLPLLPSPSAARRWGPHSLRRRRRERPLPPRAAPRPGWGSRRKSAGLPSRRSPSSCARSACAFKAASPAPSPRHCAGMTALWSSRRSRRPSPDAAPSRRGDLGVNQPRRRIEVAVPLRLLSLGLQVIKLAPQGPDLAPQRLFPAHCSCRSLSSTRRPIRSARSACRRSLLAGSGSPRRACSSRSIRSDGPP